MKSILIYDLPLRLYHLIFALLVVSALVIAKTVDDESIVFSYHMIIGLIVIFNIIFRIFWGIFGSAYSKFSSFALNPKDLVRYFRGVWTGQAKKWIGHNPASSWLAILMYIMGFGLGITGYLMVTLDEVDFVEDVHELLANGFIVLIIAHLLGIALHTVRHSDFIGLSMLNGHKKIDPKNINEDNYKAQNVSSHKWVALMYFLTIIAFVNGLVYRFNSNTGRLDLGFATLQLYEVEDENSNQTNTQNDDDSDNDDGHDQ